MDEIRNKWLNEPYETRNGNNRVSGKSGELLNDYKVFRSEWSLYATEYDSNWERS